MYYFRLIAFVVCSSYAQGADLRVASAFSSHMVVQEGEPIPIWGWAAADEDVRVRWDDGDVLTTRAVGGEWMVELPARTCGEDAFSAHTIQIESGSEALEIEDVLVGEVWLASGQSNMEWPLVMSNAFEATQALAPILGLRVFTAARISAPERMDNVEGSWKTFTAENCGSFSAVGTYFGLELLRALNKPIGVLHTSWGGSRIEAWMSPERLMEHAEGRSQLQLDPATFPPNHKPSFLSNGMIAPFEGLPLAGCIWYQGESNAEDPSAYGRLFPAMIQDWRARFGQLALPFYFVQLANFTPQAGSD